MDQEPDWAKRVASDVGKRIAGRRGKMSAQQLADRCAALGFPALSRIVITKLENGRRDAVSTAEIAVLARALDVSPAELLFAPGREETIEILPGQHVGALDAVMWFSGEVELAASGADGRLSTVPARDGEITLVRTHGIFVEDWVRVMEDSLAAPGNMSQRWRDETVLHRLRSIEAGLYQLRSAMRERGMTPPPLPAGLVHIERLQPVVAAIITSAQGVLVGRRNDGSPPWTFIAGEVEPGERPEDAAVRETKEETGLLVKAGQVIGERVHPKTRRTMIYMAALPTHGTDVFVGDAAELAEVRWVTLAEADELLPGMFEPVRSYLARVLADG